MTKHKCCAEINCDSVDILRKCINRLPNEYCNKNAKYFEEGLWYCGKHAPSRILERQRLSYEKWSKKFKINQE